MMFETLALVVLAALPLPQNRIQEARAEIRKLRADVIDARVDLNARLDALDARLILIDSILDGPIRPPVDPPVDPPPPIDPPPIDPPPIDPPPVDPPVGTGVGNVVQLFAPAPEEAFAIRFAGPVAFAGHRCDPIAWGPTGTPTAYLIEAVVDPAALPDGELDDLVIPLEMLSPAWPIPERLPSLELLVKPSGLNREVVRLANAEERHLGGLHAQAWSRLWRPGVYEFELLLEGDDDRYIDGVRAVLPAGAAFFAPGVESPSSGILVADEEADGAPFVWLAGQTTTRRFLLGREITDTDRRRFQRFEYIAKLIGPDSYDSGGWGVTGAALPNLDSALVGWDVTAERNAAAAEDAQSYEDHVLRGEHNPEFKTDAGLGPWHPRGVYSGGGSGGTEIHPYGGWARTSGEAWSEWWRMRTMLERMPRGYYSTGLPMSKPEWFRPYEKDLIKYQPHDTSHNQRAMLSPTVCVWNTGSPAAAEWLRRLPFRYDPPNPYPAEFNGKGHKYAHRAEGWAATRIANAFVLSPPGSEEREELRAMAEAQASSMLNVAMPTGIMHRSGDIHAGGPFAANLNPNLWQLGKLPEGTTVARQIMTAICGNGAMALEVGVFGDGRMSPLISDACDAAYFVLRTNGNGYVTPPAGQLIVGGLQPDDVYQVPYYGPLDDSVNVWENQWHLVDAYRVSGDEKYLRRAVEIMGWGQAAFADVGRLEYARTGSNRAWWSYTPEVVAEAQRIH